MGGDGGGRGGGRGREGMEGGRGKEGMEEGRYGEGRGRRYGGGEGMEKEGILCVFNFFR